MQFDPQAKPSIVTTRLYEHLLFKIFKTNNENCIYSLTLFSLHEKLEEKWRHCSKEIKLLSVISVLDLMKINMNKYSFV